MEKKKTINKKKTVKIVLLFIVASFVLYLIFPEFFIINFVKLNEENIVKQSEEYLKITDSSSKRTSNVFNPEINWYRNSGVVDYIVSYISFGSAAKIKGIKYSKRGTLAGYANRYVKFTFDNGKYYWYEEDGDNYEIITPITDNIYYFVFNF